MMKRIGAVLAAALLAAGLAGCIQAPAEPFGTAPTEHTEQFEVEELYVHRGDMEIYGKLYVPGAYEGKLPAVILSHSSDLTADSMKSYCERLAGMGYAAYAFDFCGGSKRSRSSGDAADMTVFTEAEDLTAVLSAIRELDCVDEQSIYLFGTSQGGLVSALVADERPDEVKGLILFYPAFNTAELIQSFYGDRKEISGEPYIQTLLEYDVYEHIGAFPGDVLILHGSRDFIVPSSYSRRAAELYAHCELYLIEGAYHGFNAENYVRWGDHDQETWAYVEDYLAAHEG